MMTIHIYHADTNEHLGSWYPESDQMQVPRKGDTVWIEDDTRPFDRWKVTDVQWSLHNKSIGISRSRYVAVEVHVRPRFWKPLWRRFVEIFPRPV